MSTLINRWVAPCVAAVLGITTALSAMGASSTTGVSSEIAAPDADSVEFQSESNATAGALLVEVFPDDSRVIHRFDLASGMTSSEFVPAAAAYGKSPFNVRSRDAKGDMAKADQFDSHATHYLVAVLYSGNSFSGSQVFYFAPNTSLTSKMSLKNTSVYKNVNSVIWKQNCTLLNALGSGLQATTASNFSTNLSSSFTPGTTEVSSTCTTNEDATAIVYTATNFAGKALPVWKDGWQSSDLKAELRPWSTVRSVAINTADTISSKHLNLIINKLDPGTLQPGNPLEFDSDDSSIDSATSVDSFATDLANGRLRRCAPALSCWRDAFCQGPVVDYNLVFLQGTSVDDRAGTVANNRRASWCSEELVCYATNNLRPYRTP